MYESNPVRKALLSQQKQAKNEQKHLYDLVMAYILIHPDVKYIIKLQDKVIFLFRVTYILQCSKSSVMLCKL